MLQDATGGNNPVTAEDFGKGFLMKQGYAILWVGWEGDRLLAENIVTIRVPVASGEDGAPITQSIAVEYFDDLHFPPDGSVSCLPPSGELPQLPGGGQRDGAGAALGARQ